MGSVGRGTGVRENMRAIVVLLEVPVGRPLLRRLLSPSATRPVSRVFFATATIFGHIDCTVMFNTMRKQFMECYILTFSSGEGSWSTPIGGAGAGGLGGTTSGGTGPTPRGCPRSRPRRRRRTTRKSYHSHLSACGSAKPASIRANLFFSPARRVYRAFCIQSRSTSHSPLTMQVVCPKFP
jgi:hypothetical protein